MRILLKRILLFALAVSAITMATAGRVTAAPPSTSSGEPLTFEGQVRPILKAHCFHCHGEGEKLEGGLDLRLKRLAERGGESGPALATGNHKASLLYERIANGEMPPVKKKVSPAELATIARWIDGGAKTARPEPETAEAAQFTDEERRFWAFQPVRRPPVPNITGGEVATPIDYFLLARLREKQLSFSPPADKRTLIRRATFDLLGLPPTPAEVDRFLADNAPDAYERLLDRLLDSPRYGERWGRHWLDVAGYADSDGYTNDDPVRKYAYKYRDYVIRSFNADKPFDEFIREQIAGDELVKPPYPELTSTDLDKLIATGFLRMGPDGSTAAGVNQKEARNQIVADTLKIVSTSLLGLSVGCAQCHNHRYDPIPQTDYYRLRAIFEPAYDPQGEKPPSRFVSLYTAEQRKRAAEIEAEAAKIDAEVQQRQQKYIDTTFEKELAKLDEQLREPIREARKTPVDKQTAEQKQLLKSHPSVNVSAGSLYLYDKKAADDLKAMVEKATALRTTKPVEEYVQVAVESPGLMPATFLFARGDILQPREKIQPGGLSILEASHPSSVPTDDPQLPTTGRRLALANSLIDGRHPLVARVLVNRIWHHHFGRGLVGTLSDFGVLGERPTHPELLDWLASEFVAGGWRLKPFHKLLMLSTAYRQSSARNAENEAVDPDNRLLSRMSVRRLEAEVIRDAILSISGRLNTNMFGQPVPVMEDEVGQIVVGIENKNGENRPGPVIPLHGEEYRRSVYVQVRRSRPLAMLDTFDAPTLEPNCELRNSSTVTPQSLMLMNSEFVVEQAELIAERVQREAGTDLAAQVSLAWQLATARTPTGDEVQEAVAFLLAQKERIVAGRTAKPGAAKPASGTPANQAIEPGLAALACLCQALVSANEFLYID